MQLNVWTSVRTQYVGHIIFTHSIYVVFTHARTHAQRAGSFERKCSQSCALKFIIGKVGGFFSAEHLISNLPSGAIGSNTGYSQWHVQSHKTM